MNTDKYIYLGIRSPSGLKVMVNPGVVYRPDELFSLPMYLDEVDHSPTGFECGYHGSGPAQLAYAILRYELGGRALALEFYQRYKQDVIAALPQDQNWAISTGDVRRWLDKTRKEIAEEIRHGAAGGLADVLRKAARMKHEDKSDD